MGDGSSSGTQGNTHMANGLIKNFLFTVNLVTLTFPIFFLNLGVFIKESSQQEE